MQIRYVLPTGAGGKPSTWLPPGRLIELLFSSAPCSFCSLWLLPVPALCGFCSFCSSRLLLVAVVAASARSCSLLLLHVPACNGFCWWLRFLLVAAAAPSCLFLLVVVPACCGVCSFLLVSASSCLFLLVFACCRFCLLLGNSHVRFPKRNFINNAYVLPSFAKLGNLKQNFNRLQLLLIVTDSADIL